VLELFDRTEVLRSLVIEMQRIDITEEISYGCSWKCIREIDLAYNPPPSRTPAALVDLGTGTLNIHSESAIIQANGGQAFRSWRNICTDCSFLVLHRVDISHGDVKLRGCHTIFRRNNPSPRGYYFYQCSRSESKLRTSASNFQN
jgi:hypothetical protein